MKKELLEVNNLALEGKPEDMVITSHICRGNYHSTFFTSGPYDSVAVMSLQKKMSMHYSLNMMMQDPVDSLRLQRCLRIKKWY